MRILHTSDWHLGQTLLDAPRDYEHGCFLRWLLTTLEREQVDALLITGDVFEHNNPPPAAQRAYYDFLLSCRARRPHLQVVVIGGNHDSAGRLDAPAGLLRTLGVTTVGGLPRRGDGRVDVDQVLVPLRDGGGGIAAWVAAIPYLRRADLAASGATGEDATDSRLSAAVRGVYAEALAEARRRRGAGQALLATGHCYMVGGRVSQESERRIQFGNQALPMDIFPEDVAYVALGHLHLAQTVQGERHVRYAGSPIPLSMIERDYPHQVLLLTVAEGRLQEVREVRVPRVVDILHVPEEHRPLAEVLPLLRALPREPPRRADGQPVSSEERPFLEVRLSREGKGGGAGLHKEVEAALEGAFARLLRISFPARPADVGEALGDQSWAESLRELDPREVFARCYGKHHPDAAEPPPQLLSLFEELLEQVTHEPEAGAGKGRREVAA